MAGPMPERTKLRRMEGSRDLLVARRVSLSTVLKAGHYRRSEGMPTLLRELEATPRDKRLDAPSCENDVLAIGALDALVATHSQHRMAVVGVDDIELASSPRHELRTFRQPVEYPVSEAIRRIIDPDAAVLGSLTARGTLVLRRTHRRRAD
jgi:DNA-binding LacI/PurR family transcriptional regulator